MQDIYLRIFVFVLFLAYYYYPSSVEMVNKEYILSHKKVKLIDVRSDLEFFSGSIPKAIHIPLGRLSADVLPEGDVVLFSQSSAKAIDGAKKLRKQGRKVKVYQGSYSDLI